MSGDTDTVLRHLRWARPRVHDLFPPTPLHTVGTVGDARIALKREDLSPIRSFKWRGAYCAVRRLQEQENITHVVAASAGNHAQGIAAAVCRTGGHADVFMPEGTPRVKQDAVRARGGAHVTVHIRGREYDEAATLAIAFARERSLAFVHPYDDAIVIAGQATVADELLRQSRGKRWDRVYVPVGGGGLAAGIALWMQSLSPETEVIGVEAMGQHGMTVALRHGAPCRLDTLDRFCDGTAVRRVGTLSFTLCQNLLHGMTTVRKDEILTAMQWLWERCRCLPEPSGALAAAAAVRDAARGYRGRCVCIVSGANMDFSALAGLGMAATA